MNELVPLLFYQIPESYLLILGSLGLLGLKGRPGRLIFAGLGLTVATQLSRRFFFNLGLHTPIILLSHIIILIIVFKLSTSMALTGCFLSYFLLKMGETLVVVPVLNWTKISFKTTIINPWLNVGFGWLSASLLLISVLICYIWRVSLVKSPAIQNGNKQHE
mgnify:FL=1